MSKITLNTLSAQQQENLKETFDRLRFEVNFGIEAENEEEAKSKMEAKISAKLEAGKSLSQKELQYLRQYNPVLYMQAVRLEQKRKALKQQLKNAESKEEVEQIFHFAMASVREDDPAKRYVVATIEETVKEFKKSDAYKKLPETEKQEQSKGKTVKERLTYEIDRHFSYQILYIDEGQNDFLEQR